MFSFLFSISSSRTLTCNAPLTHAPPPPGGTLLSFSLFLRDGLRTPQSLWLPKNASGFWLCDSDTSEAPRIHLANLSGSFRRYATPFDPSLVDYPPNCGTTDLMLQGMSSHSSLGTFYRNFLISELNFLPSEIDPAILNLRSAYPDCSFRSAESFLSSFIPPARPNEVLEITTGSAYADPLYVDYSGICPELKAVWANFTNSEEFRVRKSRAERVYAELFVKLNKTIDDTNWLFVGDWLSSAFCGGQAMANVTDEVFEQAIADWAFYNWGPFNHTRGVGGAAILRQLFEAINKSLSGQSSEKFFLFVGNHRTLVGLLNTIGVKREDLLPFETHLSVEIWEIEGAQKVRFVLNGEPIGLDLFDGESLVDYNALKSRLEPFLGYCTIFD